MDERETLLASYESDQKLLLGVRTTYSAYSYACQAMLLSSPGLVVQGEGDERRPNRPAAENLLL
jgi:hypothetical protein